MNSCKSVSKLIRKWIGYAIQKLQGLPGECILCFNIQSGSETSVWDVFFEVKDGEKSAGGSCSSFRSCFLLLETICFFFPPALDLMSKTLSGSWMKKGLLFNSNSTVILSSTKCSTCSNVQLLVRFRHLNYSVRFRRRSWFWSALWGQTCQHSNMGLLGGNPTNLTSSGCGLLWPFVQLHWRVAFGFEARELKLQFKVLGLGQKLPYLTRWEWKWAAKTVS